MPEHLLRDLPQMPRDSGAGARARSRFETIVVAAIAVVALYFAKDVLVPLAIAIVFSFALAPLVNIQRRWGIARLPAVLLTVMMAFGLIAVTSVFVGNQLSQLAVQLPRYEGNITKKIRAVRNTAESVGLVSRASGMLRQLSAEIDQSAPPQPPSRVPFSTKPSSSSAPIAVEIHEQPATPLRVAQSLIMPLLQPIATAGIVGVFVIFFLLQREDIRSRFIRVLGARDLQRTTHALDDANRRLSRYLLVQVAVNAVFGVLIGGGLALIGVPNPVLWGILAMLLRFVPYIGPMIAAAFPAALAIAVDPGWTLLLWTGVLFVVVEPIISQVVEPVLYGHTTGLSPVAVIVAAAFWTWLWGPVGLLLSMPLTLCLVVLGRHVQRLEFLDIILGDQPALTPAETLYHRLLASDASDIANQAEVFLKANALVGFYDDVMVKGLTLAQTDVNLGRLDHDERVRIKNTVIEVIEDLKLHPANAAKGEKAKPAHVGPTRVLCIAGRGSLDEAMSSLLAHLLQRHGIGAHLVPFDGIAPDKIDALDVAGISVACISYLEPDGYANARFLIRRLRRRAPHIKIMLGFWSMTAEAALHSGALEETGADALATSLKHARESIARVIEDGGETQAAE